mmetsp:Transcript_73390/g.123623  ORF Transcript_73390/g.123623 Transcript_73390/m.123623 type:complete len:84 (-) Transcript_73390:1595-1846(-)
MHAVPCTVLNAILQEAKGQSTTDDHPRHSGQRKQEVVVKASEGPELRATSRAISSAVQQHPGCDLQSRTAVAAAAAEEAGSTA